MTSIQSNGKENGILNCTILSLRRYLAAALSARTRVD